MEDKKIKIKLSDLEFELTGYVKREDLQKEINQSALKKTFSFLQSIIEDLNKSMRTLENADIINRLIVYQNRIKSMIITREDKNE